MPKTAHPDLSRGPALEQSRPREPARGSRAVPTIIGVALTLSALLLWWLLALPASDKRIFHHYSQKRFVLLLAASYLLAWAAYVTVGSPARRRKKLVRFLGTSFTIVILLSILELPAFFRVLDYRLVLQSSERFAFTRVKPWNNPAYRLDSQLLYLRPPNAHLKGVTRGDLSYYLQLDDGPAYPFDVRYDSNGFRNDRDLMTASIALLGDSFAESPLVPRDDTLCGRLEHALGVDVANLGQMGYGPQQELIVLHRFALKLKPKLVIWLFYEGNDLRDVDRYEDTLKTWDRTMRERSSFKARSFTGNALLALAVLTSAPASSAKSPASADLAQRLSATHVDPSGRPVTIHFGEPQSPLTPADLDALLKAQRCIREGKSACDAAGAEFLLAFVPTKYRAIAPSCSFPDGSEAANWTSSDLPARLASWCADSGIHFIDFTPVLQACADKAQLPFFPDDAHWNAAGNAAAADAVIAFVRKSGALRAR